MKNYVYQRNNEYVYIYFYIFIYFFYRRDVEW